MHPLVKLQAEVALDPDHGIDAVAHDHGPWHVGRSLALAYQEPAG